VDQQLLQRTRYLLQTRFRRLRSASDGNIELVCAQVLSWLENHPILSGILQHLDNVPGEHHQEIQLMRGWKNGGDSRYWYIAIAKSDRRQEDEPDFKGYTPKNLEEHASACLEIIRALIAIQNQDFHKILAVYLTMNYKFGENPYESIKDICIRDLYEYLDEQLDGINAVNGLLRKYKQNAEWFQRQRLQQIKDEYEGKSGEKALALHLQQYIFDQGVEFVIEPTSASGEVDLLLRDSAGQYTIIDAKYIELNATRSEIVSKIAKGFNQVARYCNDYNQHEGFLAVFVNDDISILVELKENDGFKYFEISGNIIYYIEINMSERLSASKSGKAKQISIAKNELSEEIKVQEGANSGGF
jgi:hypothetical protein